MGSTGHGGRVIAPIHAIEKLTRRPDRLSDRSNAPRILFLSNGHGEDAIGAEIARRLHARNPSYDLAAVPIVGNGDPYRAYDIRIASRTETMPSGGIMYANQRAVWRDIRHGVLGLAIDQIRTLRLLAPTIDLVVGIGDKVILYLHRLFIRQPLVFVGVAYSAHYTKVRQVYSRGLRRILDTYSPLIYARDELTATQLRDSGLQQARFVGNPMMDCFDVTGDGLGIPFEQDVVGILPGSREEAYGNLKLVLRGIGKLHNLARDRKPALAFVVALAGNLDLKTLGEVVSGDGWQLRAADGTGADSGIVATLHSADGCVVRLARGRFGDVITRASVVVGLAGTANEQAVGSGKAVVTFPGTGEQTPPRFADSQRRLLGDAVVVTTSDAEAIARDTLDLLNDRERLARMGQAGRERMGEPGGVERIVDGICGLLAVRHRERTRDSSPDEGYHGQHDDRSGDASE